MKLGQGTYGLVKKEKGKAVKYIDTTRHHLREFIMMCIFKDCENIVKIKDVNFDNLSISMELYDSDLKSYIDSHNTSDSEKYFIVCEIAKGLHQMHSVDISHADLKLDNILVNFRDTGKGNGRIGKWNGDKTVNITKLVLGDCGFSCDHKYARIKYTARKYRDKEIINDGRHDIFSFGICLYEIVTDSKLEGTPGCREMLGKSRYVKNKMYRNILMKIFGKRNERPTTSEILEDLDCKCEGKDIPDLFNDPKHIDVKIDYPGLTGMKNSEEMKSVMNELKDLRIGKNEVRSVNNGIVNDVSEDSKMTILEIFYLSEKYGMTRCNKAYIILIYFLRKYKVDKEHYCDWISVMFFILYNMFPCDKLRKGYKLSDEEKRRLTEREKRQIKEKDEKERHEIFNEITGTDFKISDHADILNMMVNDEYFIYLLI